MKTFCVACIVGARPNFIKMASLIGELRRRSCWQARLIHTGQHYSPEMSDSLFRDLQLPEPDLNLGLGGGSQTEQTAEIMKGLESVFSKKHPDLMLVVGDVNSTMAAALVAAKMGIRIAHVEAGLRSFDRRMPEEINRLVTDTLSDYLFVSEPSGVANLLAEGLPESKIFFVGNVMIDTLLRFRERANRSQVLDQYGLQEGGYIAVTLHRPSNVDDPIQLKGLVSMLVKLSGRIPVVFPVHPRTRHALERAAVKTQGLILSPPLGYLDFLRLMSASRLVLTDSGGIQEETTILKVPCLTLRENTERPVTITEGTNRLAGTNPDKVLAAACEALDYRPDPSALTPHLWDGHASARIVSILEEKMAAEQT